MIPSLHLGPKSFRIGDKVRWLVGPGQYAEGVILSMAIQPRSYLQSGAIALAKIKVGTETVTQPLETCEVVKSDSDEKPPS